MLRIASGKSSTAYCDGQSRRSFVQLGVAGLAAASLGDVLRAQAWGKEGGAGSDHACILLWLDGGPGHMDMYDMKPDAPAEYRGIWQPIKTNVPGIEITELFPQQAKVADKFAILRSLHHDDGDHFGGAHRMLTTKPGVNGANQEGRFPGIGAVVARQAGPRHADMPPYVAVPYASSVGRRPGYFGGNFIGAAYDPFETSGDPNAAKFQVRNVGLDNSLTIERLEDRRSLRDRLDRIERNVDRAGVFGTLDRFEQDALQMVTGPRARAAFDISQESDALRDTYGRNTFGQSALLARRLVEHGSRFVTVHSGGWDHHWNLQEGMERLLPQVDAAVAGLLTDLDQRGMLETTLVVMCGEFSRTPRMNDGSGNGTPGRDHWGNSMFVLMAGGGIRGGQAYGSTDSKGERPQDSPVTCDNFHATIYKSLRIDPHIRFLNLQGRPSAVLEDTTPIDGMFG
ncbi:MAG: DUF1501 domain-containing protein [Planctomycetales bacterium]|nr:DUF1501 domain-containing protein [Planctomycetales bacterium]